MRDCEICGGCGKIRLPVRERLSAVVSDISYMSKIREYSCPECGDKIPQENIMVVQAEEWVSGDIKDSNLILHCKRAIADRIGQFLFDEYLITYSKDTKVPEYSWREDYVLKGKLGVLSSRFVAKFEDRIREHQEVVAKEVVEEAIKAIRNWDSMCKNPIIQKDMAIRFLYEALDRLRG